MNAFARLGLEPDADEAQIRRAYARELRQARPDENPAAFQELNEAYRQCLDYAAWRASGGEEHWDEDGEDEEAEPSAAVPEDAVRLRMTSEELIAALDQDAHPDGTDAADEPAYLYLDRDAFVAGLFEISSVGSGADVHSWLQTHPAFYAIGAREALAPQVLDALIDAPDLPPRHLAALLHFFHLDEVGPLHDQMYTAIAQLQQRARMTPEHYDDARRLFGTASPPPREHFDVASRVVPWLLVAAMLSLGRCFHAGTGL